uniref:Neutrophil cytosolic factor 2 n=1 Tax=Cyclopterus lumpus TaxID=8103 RepID=A0A8C2ZRB7_CYCLU
MSFVDTLRQWDQAVTCVDVQDLTEALRIFLSIQEPNSKIYFNIGCLHLLNRDLDAAEKAFDCSIGKDEHLAVAFFQRGMTFYRMKSLADFQQAFKALRGNQLIDYKALGLRYKLYACEVLLNMALSEAQLGNWEKAHINLVKALNYKTDAKLNIIDRALDSALKQKLFKPVEFPSKVLFKPNKHYVAELEKKDYLGKAKVVASVVPQDAFSGFAPLKPQVEDGPACPKEPEVLRALEGEPHTVLFKFVPETSDELAVVPGNIVFVLQKGADNWASVIFNERVSSLVQNLLTSEATEQSVITPSTEMESMWRGASGLRITLWCHANEHTDGTRQSEIHLVALHSYESSNPEDLNFHQGDTITLLSKVNQDWLEGQCSGATGIFPASFVEEVPVNDQSSE